MKKKYYNYLMILSAAITIFGIVTGKFLFLFIMLPFGLNIFKSKDHEED